MTADEIVQRLDKDVLSSLIYRYFYNGPVGGARQRLAKIIRNHALGLPIMTFNEVLHEFLMQETGAISGDDPLVAEQRSVFWKALNGAGEPAIVDRLIAYAAAKELTECIADTLARQREPEHEA